MNKIHKSITSINNNSILEAIRQITLGMYKKYGSKELELELTEDIYKDYCNELNIDSTKDSFEYTGINGIKLKVRKK